MLISFMNHSLMVYNLIKILFTLVNYCIWESQLPCVVLYDFAKLTCHACQLCSGYPIQSPANVSIVISMKN